MIRNDYNGRHDHLVSAFAGLTERLGPGCTVTTAVGADDVLSVIIPIENTGGRAGDEVAQPYPVSA